MNKHVKRLTEIQIEMRSSLAERNTLAERIDNAKSGAELSALEKQSVKLERKFEALSDEADLIRLEAEEELEAARGRPSDEVGSNGGRHPLASKIQLRSFLEAFKDQRSPDGAEGELADELYGSRDKRGPGGGMILPWEALETRADVATSVGAGVSGPTGQPGIVQRIFARSVGAFLGVSFEQVGIGERSYPVISAGASPEQKAAGSVKDAQAATIDANDLPPLECTARYIYRSSDAARIAGLESALRDDLARAIVEEHDDQILNGNGTAPQVDGIIAEFANPAPNPGAVAKYNDFVNEFGKGVDGKHAAMLSEMRGVFNVATYALAGAVQANSNKGDLSAIDYLQKSTGGVRCSSVMPAAASNISTAILYRSGGMGMDAVAPMWGLEIIEDRYTRANRREVALTICSLWNFAVLRTAAYKRIEFKTS